MITYRKAQSQEFPKVLDFVNMVFSMAHKPHDFRQLLPKLYQEGQEENSIHYLALENNEIRACVCVLPITLCCGEAKITCATVGSVSVHPYSRGKGYMQTLMNMAIQDMKKNNISMSSLSGRRNRYQYYGYEKGGFFFEYRFTPDNFRHCRENFPKRRISLCQIESPENTLLPLIHNFQQKRILFSQRDSRDFLMITKSWNAKLYAIMEEQTCKGYAVLLGNQIIEIYLAENELLFAALEACLKECAMGELYLRVAPYDFSMLQGITSLHESFTLSLDDNYMIFDYPKVLEFFLKVKASYIHLDSGCLNLSIKGKGCFHIQVKNGVSSVTLLEDVPADQIPVLELNPLDSISMLFSSNPQISPKSSQFFRKYNWFPLPLALSPLDKC